MQTTLYALRPTYIFYISKHKGNTDLEQHLKKEMRKIIKQYKKKVCVSKGIELDVESWKKQDVSWPRRS